MPGHPAGCLSHLGGGRERILDRTGRYTTLAQRVLPLGGSAAAVANAVNNALMPLGVSLTDLPFNAPAVWGALQGAARAGDRKKRAA